MLPSKTVQIFELHSGCFVGIVEVFKPIVALPLQHLRLHDMLNDLSNPICMRSSYKTEVTRYLPSLESLDGEALTGSGEEWIW